MSPLHNYALKLSRSEGETFVVITRNGRETSFPFTSIAGIVKVIEFLRLYPITIGNIKDPCNNTAQVDIAFTQYMGLLLVRAKKAGYE